MNYNTKIKTIQLFILSFALFVSMALFAGQKDANDKNKKIAKNNTNDARGLFNVNSLEFWFNNGGQGATDPAHQDAQGFYYPRGTDKSAIYQDGFVWTGLLNAVDGTKPLISGGATYVAGLQAGPILTNGSVSGTTYTPAVAATSGDAKYKVYKINKGDDATSNADYANWPFADGAPALQKVAGGDSLDANGAKIPQLLGDQTLFYVANDMSSSRQTSLYGSIPVGIEVQTTVFGFSVSPYETMVFTSRKMINKSGLKIDSMYVSAWSDPDLGNSADDFVGVDVQKKLGYVYNATNSDNTYNGGTVPAAGYVFFRGPKVGNDYLGLSSFAYYIGSGGPDYLTDPPLGSYTGTVVLNRYQRGLNYFRNPLTTQGGDPTAFPLSGYPEDGTGDIEGTLFGPGDRRLLLSSGPFTMASGDTQVIVTATLVAEGTSNLGSIKKLRNLANKAQFAFDNNFKVPQPPPAPVVAASALDKTVILDWSNPVSSAKTENDIQGAFKFEGYRVYQLPDSSTRVSSKAALVAQFDIIDGITAVNDLTDDPVTGEEIPTGKYFFKESGIQRSIVITTDRFTNEPLKNNREYYFAVVAINVFNPNPNVAAASGIKSSNENAVEIIKLTPREPNAGVRFEGTPGNVLTSVHSEGASDGSIEVTVIDPTKTTGADYKVEFTDDGTGTFLYNVKNLTTNQNIYATPQTQSENIAAGSGNATVDGLKIVVAGPTPGLKLPTEWQIPSGARQFTWVSGDGFALEGFNGALSWTNPGNFFNGGPVVPAANLKTVLLKLAKVDVNGVPADANDENLSYGYRYLRGATAAAAQPDFASHILNNTANYGLQDFAKTIPLSAWDISDPANPKRLALGYLENNAVNGLVDGKYWPGRNGAMVGGDNNTSATGAREWLFIFPDAYSETKDNTFDSPILAASFPHPGMYMATWVRRNNTGWSAAGTGVDQFQINCTKINTPTDVFTFKAPGQTFSAATAKNDIQKINVYPNPYFGANPLEVNRYERFVTFTHLTGKATLKIFSLSGQFVQEIKHDNGTPYERWNLLNSSNLPVASGMYIVHIETEYGTKILKIAVIQEAQYLENVL